MICPKCRKDSPPDAAFCPYCGKKLVSTKKSRTKSRGNGTGTAFKRGNTWTAQVVLRYEDLPPFDLNNPENKKPRKKITRSKGGFKTRDAALQYCPILKSGPQKPKQAPLLEEYWEVFKKGAYASLTSGSQRIHRWAWNMMSPLHKTSIDQILISDLQNIITSKCDTFEKGKRCRTLMSLLFKLAAADGYVSKDIPSFVQIPKQVHTEREAFSDTEQAALWKLYESGDMRAAIPLLMIYTGMMPGEAMQIRIENIDLKKQQITGVGKKTKVRRETPVVLADTIIPVVEKLIENARPDGLLWPNYRKAFCPLYYEALEAAGVRKLSPYSCRHTTATALAVTKNIAPETIKKVMRWSSTRMLDNYAHPTQEDALKAVNTL